MVNVTDSNDNHPIFNIPTGGYVTSLLEGSSLGAEVITVTATDIDQGVNMEILYSLNSTDTPFQINDPRVRV